MPWTKINYPDSMKRLPVAVRNKAIQIANVLFKENKKMKEGVLIATSIRNAKDFVLKKKTKTKRVANKETKKAAGKKLKNSSKTKFKSVAKKKIKRVANPKTKKETAKKINSFSKVKAIISAKKKVKSPLTIKSKRVVRKEVDNSIQEKVKSPVIEPALSENITHGEDLHFIPEHHEALHPFTPSEIRRDENVFHHREEVAFHQENQKVKEAMSTRKNYKRNNRQTRRR